MPFAANLGFHGLAGVPVVPANWPVGIQVDGNYSRFSDDTPLEAGLADLWRRKWVRGSAAVLADGEADWEAFRSTVVRGLGNDCRIGVGGSMASPADVPRSYREA